MGYSPQGRQESDMTEQLSTHKETHTSTHTLPPQDSDFPGGADGEASDYNAGYPGPLGWEDPLEKEMTTHSSTLAWKILWTEEYGRLQSMGSQRIRHN